jgi:hypothetical protein
MSAAGKVLPKSFTYGEAGIICQALSIFAVESIRETANVV